MSSPPPSRHGHRLLRCPICRRDLLASGGTLACGNRHSFDIARSGYVNLLGGRGRLPAAGGDSAVQLRHRAAFLEAGHLDAVGEIIARHVQSITVPPDDGWRLLEAGCGTAHHLGKIAALLPAPVVGLGLDISPAAGRQAARRWPGFAFAIVDVWREWPVHDAIADLVVSVMAPRNFPEAARVLRPGGVAAVVYAGPDHLCELRQRYGLMGQHGTKERYATAMADHIGPPAAARSWRRTVLEPGAVRQSILMGPNAHARATGALEIDAHPQEVTLDLIIVFAQKPLE